MIETGGGPGRRPVRSGRRRPATDVRTLALVYGVRRVPTAALGVTSCGCAAVVWASAAGFDSTQDLIPVVRTGSVLFAAAAATCLEDSNAEVVVTTSFGLLRYRSLSVTLTGLATVALWWVVVLGAALIDRDANGAGLPAAGLAVELVALCAFGWVVASLLQRGAAWRGTGVRSAAIVVVAALFTLGHRLSLEWLWAAPGPTWRATHAHWAAVGLLAALGFVVLGRDPAARAGWALVRPAGEVGT